MSSQVRCVDMRRGRMQTSMSERECNLECKLMSFSLQNI